MRPTKKKKKTRHGRKKIYDDTRPGTDFYDNYLLGQLSGAWTSFSPDGDSEGTKAVKEALSLIWSLEGPQPRAEPLSGGGSGGARALLGSSIVPGGARLPLGELGCPRGSSVAPGGARSLPGERGHSFVDRSIAGDIIPAEHICDMSSVVSAAATTTTVVHLRKLNGEELPSLTPLQSADCRNGDGEAIALPEVLAESDEEKKADAAIVDTGGDTHIKITGRDRVADYDCDYRYGTGIMDENMEYRSGDGGSSPDGNEPSPVARALYDWHLVDFGANFAIDSNRVAWLRHHYEYVKHWWSLGIGIGIG